MSIVRRGDDFLPLGINRFRILDCMGGNDSHSPDFFQLVPGQDIVEAFESHFSRLSQKEGYLAHRGTRLLLAAARLLSGDMTAADVIIDDLPAERLRLDHGSGYCKAAHLVAFAAAMPIPKELQDTNAWLAGSPEQEALRSWLAEHREALRWNRLKVAYVRDADC